MYYNQKILAKNSEGQLTYHTPYDIYCLTFNNIYLEFKEKEFIRFKEFILDLVVEYTNGSFDRVTMNRKVPIKTMQENLSLVFNKQELDSLKILLTQTDKSSLENLNVYDIDYLFYLN